MNKFYTLITQYGLERLANISASGNKIQFKTIAVGDGEDILDKNATDISHRVKTIDVSSVELSPTDKTKLEIKGIIPVNSGGYNISEMGVFDETGKLFIVCKVPKTYKPNINEGTATSMILRVQVQYSNFEGNVEFFLDDSVEWASKGWVESNYPNKYYLLSNYYTKKESDDRYLKINGKAQDSNKLDGYDSSDFLLKKDTNKLDFIKKSQRLSTKNLNDVFEESFYQQEYTKDATAERNYPITEAGFMIVGKSAGLAHQIYITYSTGRMFSRSYYNGSWLKWIEIGKKDSIDSYTKKESDDRYLKIDGKAIDSDKLDGIDSKEFLRIGSAYTKSEVDAKLKNLSVPFYTFKSNNKSPLPGTFADTSISGFTAYMSTDFPGNYFTGITIIGAQKGQRAIQLAGCWDSDGRGNFLYFRSNDDTSDIKEWDKWIRLMNYDETYLKAQIDGKLSALEKLINNKVKAMQSQIDKLGRMSKGSYRFVVYNPMNNVILCNPWDMKVSRGTIVHNIGHKNYAVSLNSNWFGAWAGAPMGASALNIDSITETQITFRGHWGGTDRASGTMFPTLVHAIFIIKD